MGTLSTADLGGNGGPRSRCPCGEWHATLGDDGRGTWIFHDERWIAFAVHCRPCARALAARCPEDARAIYEYVFGEQPATSAPAGASRRLSGTDDPQDPPERTRAQNAPRHTSRRRSDVQ